jgi:hypothetical protein
MVTMGMGSAWIWVGVVSLRQMENTGSVFTMTSYKSNLGLCEAGTTTTKTGAVDQTKNKRQDLFYSFLYSHCPDSCAYHFFHDSGTQLRRAIFQTKSTNYLWCGPCWKSWRQVTFSFLGYRWDCEIAPLV